MFCDETDDIPLTEVHIHQLLSEKSLNGPSSFRSDAEEEERSSADLKGYILTEVTNNGEEDGLCVVGLFLPFQHSGKNTNRFSEDGDVRSRYFWSQTLNRLFRDLAQIWQISSESIRSSTFEIPQASPETKCLCQNKVYTYKSISLYRCGLNLS